ncbi:MAG: AIR synthase-related protein [Patescibacteria group bacterium]|nr:AIR synthase-related protein [Patescibacteria group bacterium]
MPDKYRTEIIDPGDQASHLAHEVCVQSYSNCPAVIIIPHQPGNFRGPVGFLWKPHILEAMARNRVDPQSEALTHWEMLQEVENDGAGGKPQFFTLLGIPEFFQRLGFEIITMTADDFARSGRFPAVMVNEINAKRITAENFPLFKATMEGYGEALKQSGLVNITGEIAIMKHSITAFCDTRSSAEFILTWGGTCIGLAHRDLLTDGSEIKPGMPIVGFWEPGYRCNGGTFFTNLILKKFGPEIQRIKDNPRALDFIANLTIPSRSYARTITRIAGWYPDGSIGKPLAKIYGIAHITGGGVWKKFGELLPEGVGANLDSMPEPAEVLRQGQELSWDLPDLRLTDRQAYGTLHGGCGMLIICAKNDAEKIIAEAKKDIIRAEVVGETTISPDREVIIHSRFKEGGILSSKDRE